MKMEPVSKHMWTLQQKIEKDNIKVWVCTLSSYVLFLSV